MRLPSAFSSPKPRKTRLCSRASVVPDSDPSIPQAYKDAGLKFDGSKALPANLVRPFPGLGAFGSRRMSRLQTSTRCKWRSIAASRAGSVTASPTPGRRRWAWPPATADFVNPYNTRLYDYRLLDFDRAHAFTATYIYDVPKLGRKLGDNRFTRGLLDGWQISGITCLISGNPFELGVGIGGGVNANQRITGSWTEPSRFRLKGDPKNGPNGLLINPDAFIIPELGSLGLGERTYLRNPGINNTDLSIFKNFYIGDPDKGRQIQLRFEAFNVFNHTQFAGINAGTALSVAECATNAFVTGNGDLQQLQPGW